MRTARAVTHALILYVHVPVHTAVLGAAAHDAHPFYVRCDTLSVSAHWCGPCKAFTPELAKAYTNAYKNKGMEIVFVSSDRDEAAFKDYCRC